MIVVVEMPILVVAFPFDHHNNRLVSACMALALLVVPAYDLAENEKHWDVAVILV